MRESILAHPSLVERLVAVARKLRSTHRPGEAAQLVEIAAALSPHGASLREEAHRLRGEEGIEDFDRELKRRNLEASHALGMARIYQNRGEFDRAVEMSELAKNRTPFNYLAFAAAGYLCQRNGDLGNMVSPLAMRERYGFEAFRYFLLREMSFGNDASFSEEALVERVNADLANNLGNLVGRTLNLVEKLCGGAIPEPRETGGAEAALARETEAAERAVAAHMEELRLHDALASILACSGAVNRYLDAEAPWKAVKQPGGEMNGNAAEVTTTPFAFTSMYRRPNLETKARCACRDRPQSSIRSFVPRYGRRKSSTLLMYGSPVKPACRSLYPGSKYSRSRM